MQCISHLWPRTRKKKPAATNVELGEKYQRGEGSRHENKEDSGKAKPAVIREKGRAEEQEESVTLHKLQLQLDPKEIWRLVQKEIENECLSDSGQNLSGTAGAVSADSVLDRSRKQEEIHALRSRLACRTHLVHALVDAMSTKIGRHQDCKYPWKSEEHNPSSPLVEALTLHDFLNANHSCRSSHKQQTSASADSILDARRPEADSGLTVDHLANSCPTLNPGHRHVLVTSSTQTDLAAQTTPVHHRLGNLQGNISSSSSTSGAVDLDFDYPSNKAHTFPRRREGVKSVHIVDSAHHGGLEVDDSNTVRRNSFKCAIERGQSLESSQSFDAEPGSGETTPDRIDQIPPITTLHKDNAGLHDVGFAVHCAQQDPVTLPPGVDCGQTVCQHPPEYYVAIERSRSLNASRNLTSQAVKSAEEKPVLKLPRWGEASEYFEDHKGDFQSGSGIHLDMNVEECCYDNQGIMNTSQDGSRRLSMLVEEGSDAEAEESVTNPSPPLALKSTVFPFPTHTTHSKPPQYKAPPAYTTAVEERHAVVRSDSDPIRKSPRLSEHAAHHRSDSDPSSHTIAVKHTPITGDSPRLVTKSALKSREPPPPYSSHSPRVSRTRFADESISMGSPRLSRGVADLSMPSTSDAHSPPPQRESTYSPKSVLREEQRPLSPARLKRRHLLEDSKKKKDSVLDELLNGNLEETYLSEADKETNNHLLEEARRASSRHKTRRRRSSGSASPGADLARSQSFDEGTEDVGAVAGDDVFKSHGSPPPGRTSGALLTEEVSGKDEGKSDSAVLVSVSEKTTTTAALHPTPTSQQKTFKITTQLAKIREENLSKKRGHMKHSKMQELQETSETESVKAGSGGSMDSESGASTVQENRGREPEILPPPPSTTNPIFPSLPDDFLSRLGLQTKKGEAASEIADQFSDQELEEKFATLALAFKTDKLTLDKRIDLQQRARDIAEQNIDREMEGLKDALKAFSHFCTEPEVRDVFTKIQHHVDVLEQSTARVSSRAEVHGAVQQELRMSKAIDVMVQHVDNLKRLQEREHLELEESKRLIQESRLGSSSSDVMGVDSLLSKRSFSIAAGMPMKGGRRRASVCVVPKAAPSVSPDTKFKLQNLFSSAANRSNLSLGSLDRQSSISALNLDTPTTPNNTSPVSPEPSPFNDSTSDESSFLPPSPPFTLRRRLGLNNNEINDNDKPLTNGNVVQEKMTTSDDKELSQQPQQQHILLSEEDLSRLQAAAHAQNGAVHDALLGHSDIEDYEYDDDSDTNNDVFHETFLQRMKNKLHMPPMPTISATRVRYTVAGLLLCSAVIIVIMTLLQGITATRSLEEIIFSHKVHTHPPK